MKSGADTFRRAFPQARSLWDATIKNVGRIEAFWLNGVVVLIQDFRTAKSPHNFEGWQVYTPTTDDGLIVKTLEAIATRCGTTVDGAALISDDTPEIEQETPKKI